MAQIKHVFGRDITVRYIPAADGEEFTAYSLTSCRLYYPTFPTVDQQLNTASGHLQEVTSWTLVNEEGTGPAEYKIAFSAIADPYSFNQTPYERYYIALNYKTELGGIDLRDVQLIPIYRPDGFLSKVRVEAQDVYDIDSTVESMAPSPLWTEAKIDAAIEDIETRIEALGNLKARVFNWEKLNACVRRLALSYCCLSLANDGSQFWFQKAKFWKEEADKKFNAASYGVDTYATHTPEPTAKVTTGAVAPLR